MEWIGTESMVADGLTKALSRNKFECFVRQVGLYRGCDPGFRGSVEVVNQDHEWILVKRKKKRKESLRKT